MELKTYSQHVVEQRQQHPYVNLQPFHNTLTIVVRTPNRCPQVDWQNLFPQHVTRSRVEHVTTQATCCGCCESDASLHYKALRSTLPKTGNRCVVCCGKLVCQSVVNVNLRPPLDMHSSDPNTLPTPILLGVENTTTILLE